MKYSQLFGKTRRQDPRDEESTNARLLIRAGFVRKEVAGVYNFLPLGLRVLNKIAQIIREEMNAAGGPTHEEVLVPIAAEFVKSCRDLPLYIYQIQNKFRDEPRAKAGLLRGREFLMKDLYSFHTDEA